ncbi:LD-carboxypeptidase, partial [Lysobacter sp. D1-1-M9]
MHRRDFLGSAALTALLPLIGTGGIAVAAEGGRVLPVTLNPGDTVGLVSPSSATDERLNLQLAREV